MLELQDKKEIEKMINQLTGKTYQKRVGDTPTDALQLVPKKYTDNLSSFKIASSGTSFKIGGSIFDHYATVGTTHTDGTEDILYSDTIPANMLGANGAKIEAEYGGAFASSATATRQVRVNFAGSTIFDTGNLTLSLSAAWTCYVCIIRSASNGIRAMTSFTTEGAALAAYTAVTIVGGITLTNAQPLYISGTAAGTGAAANDIAAQIGNLYYFPAA